MFELSEVAIASFYEELEKIAASEWPQPGTPEPASEAEVMSRSKPLTEEAYQEALKKPIPKAKKPKKVKTPPVAPTETAPEAKTKPAKKPKAKAKVEKDVAEEAGEAVEKGVKETAEAAEKSEISKIISEAGDEVGKFVKNRPILAGGLGLGALGATALGTHILGS